MKNTITRDNVYKTICKLYKDRKQDQAYNLFLTFAKGERCMFINWLASNNSVSMLSYIATRQSVKDSFVMSYN